MIAADKFQGAKYLQELPRLELVHIQKVHTLKTKAHYYFLTKIYLS